jgi:glucose/arabinose dehydrogenase
MHARALVVAALLSVLVPARSSAADLTPRPFLDDLAFPTNMAFLPDGSLLFTEKETGNVRVVSPEGMLRDRPFVTLPVIGEAERGLLGIAVHPEFEQEPWVYLYRSDPTDGVNRLVRVRAERRSAVGEPEVLLDGISAVAGYHNGGDLAFALDGTLFVSLGEAHDPDRAQDEEDIGGTIARLEADGSVPADNPFGPDNPAWSIGHRNSFGLCVDPGNGDLWETENGPDRDDEVNMIEAGGNYGWPVVTGSARDERFIDPIVVFPRPIALTGCAVVDGDLWFGSFDGRLWRLSAGSDRAREIASFDAGVTDVALGPDDRLYVATSRSIATLPVGSAAPAPASSIATPEPSGEAPDPAGPSSRQEPSPWRPWAAIGAAVVLAAALGARFLAGRRLRRDVSAGSR